MFWFNKKHPNVLYLDNRTLKEEKLTNGQRFKIAPDRTMDFRSLQLESMAYHMVVFDPPHLTSLGAKSYMAKKYGYLNRKTWREDIAKGFSECWRILKYNGVLIFKWNEHDVPLKEVLALFPAQPLFGHKTGVKTHWLCFMKL